MASNKTVTDDSTTAEGANMNKFVTGTGISGTTNAWGLWGMCINYTGAAWQVRSGYGGGVSESGNVSLAFSTANDRLEIDLSGCTNQFSQKPTVVCTPFANNARYYCKAEAATADLIYVYFYDFVTANWNSQTRVATADANMDFNIIMFGEIG